MNRAEPFLVKWYEESVSAWQESDARKRGAPPPVPLARVKNAFISVRIVSVFRPALVVCLFAAPVWAQERRAVVFGTIGGAGLGHADSEQGNAPIFGGGAGYHLTPRLVVEGDVHGARVSHVFDRDHHDFREITFTGSLIFRSTPQGRAHFIAGGGAGLQRAHTDVDEPLFRIDRTETIPLLHGRIGADWDISSRMAIRTEGVMWFGEGLDWVVGARTGVSYRF